MMFLNFVLDAAIFLSIGYAIGSVATMNKYGRDHKRMCEQLDQFRNAMVKIREIKP